MLRNMKMKKISVGLLISMLMMAMLAMPVMAAVDYPMITLEDSEDFTVVGEIDDSESMTVLGLDDNFQTHPLGSDEQYVTWTTSDEDVVLFDDGSDYIDTIYETDTVDVVLVGEGTSIITATYDTPNANPVTVTSYVVVEGSTVTSSISGIDVAVEGFNTPEFTLNSLTVPLFSLVDAGITDNDDDVLKNTPSVLHAFLYALEIQNSDETTSTPIEDFDWDWVIDNVDITSEGSYVSAVGADNGNINFSRGWQYGIDSLDPNNRPDHAASVQPLSTGNEIYWGFIPW